MRNIIIDCDPGHDDAFAIFVALAHRDSLILSAITTVCGNNTLDNMTQNARYVLDIANAQTILAKGATRPLVGEPVISDEFHGKTGMDGPTELPCGSHPVNEEHAVNVIRNILADSTDKITIAALAPLTNIALFIRMYPELVHKIEMISLMGGGLAHGNCTQYAEFNIFVDPEAAEIVFNSGIPIVMSGLDVTTKALIYRDMYEHLRTQSKIGRFFSELMDFYMKSARKFGLDGAAMHDPCAIAYLLRPDIFSGFATDIQVVLGGEKRGQTVSRKSDHPSVTVLTDVDSNELASLVVRSIEKLAEIK